MSKLNNLLIIKLFRGKDNAVWKAAVVKKKQTPWNYFNFQK